MLAWYSYIFELLLFADTFVSDRKPVLTRLPGSRLLLCQTIWHARKIRGPECQLRKFENLTLAACQRKQFRVFCMIFGCLLAKTMCLELTTNNCNMMRLRRQSGGGHLHALGIWYVQASSKVKPVLFLTRTRFKNKKMFSYNGNLHSVSWHAWARRCSLTMGVYTVSHDNNLLIHTQS